MDDDLELLSQIAAEAHALSCELLRLISEDRQTLRQYYVREFYRLRARFSEVKTRIGEKANGRPT
jgi:hypothetical protein